MGWCFHGPLLFTEHTGDCSNLAFDSRFLALLKCWHMVLLQYVGANDLPTIVASFALSE
jgi:hypothetical protein